MNLNTYAVVAIAVFAISLTGLSQESDHRSQRLGKTVFADSEGNTEVASNYEIRINSVKSIEYGDLKTFIAEIRNNSQLTLLNVDYFFEENIGVIKFQAFDGITRENIDNWTSSLGIFKYEFKSDNL